MKLPPEFLEKMETLLDPDEYAGFLESYSRPRHYGLRVNTLKISVEEFLKLSPFALERVPWTPDGFYYPEGGSPGRHPYYHAGLYYIQEPSAMLPGQVLGALPGERVLDLCAAPGGKTVQIAAAMKGRGLLVANDINADRVRALVKNIELCGVRNAVVLNETPEKLAQRFEGWFDRILVDAPCSGEGMFRKDEDAARSWGSFKCEVCSGMQRDILRSADRLLKPGGTLVYSTCTFSPEEDEAMISKFLDENAGYEIVEIPGTAGMEGGRPHWADGRPELAGTARLWPHRVRGEGHFAAKLRKSGSPDNPQNSGNLCNPGNPGNPYSPGNLCNPNNQGNPGNSYNLCNPGDLCNPNNQGNPRNSYNLCNPGNPGNSYNLYSPGSLCNPNKPGNPRNSGKLCNPGSLCNPNNSNNPGNPGNSYKQCNPGNPGYPNNPGKPYAPCNTDSPEKARRRTGIAGQPGGADLPEAYAAFVRENLNILPEGFYFRKGRNLYLLPEPPPDLDGLKVAKFGWFMGELAENRFEPSHSLATALGKGDFKRVTDLAPDSREVRSYLKCETLMLEGERGLTGVCAGGYSLGWAKQTGGMLKNLYPKGWRRMN